MSNKIIANPAEIDANTAVTILASTRMIWEVATALKDRATYLRLVSHGEDEMHAKLATVSEALFKQIGGYRR